MSESESEPTEEAGGGSDFADMIGKLGAGEKLAVLGAAAVLAVWLLFDLLIDEYSTGSLPFALALVVVGAAYVRHQGSGNEPVPYKSLLFVGAGLLGVLGAVDVIEELRNNILDADGTTVIGALLYYAGAITSGVGALQLRGK